MYKNDVGVMYSHSKKYIFIFYCFISFMNILAKKMFLFFIAS